MNPILFFFEKITMYTDQSYVWKSLNSPGDADYKRGDQVSPWVVIKGWHLLSCFHDPMHVIYLGTFRDLFASILGYWLRNTNVGGAGSYSLRLRQISIDLKSMCREQQCL